MKNRIIPIAVALFIINVLVMYSIRPYGYNMSSMIRIAENEEEGVVKEYFQKGFVIFTDGGGYDGQYYYYSAMDPLMKDGVYKNAFRQQRVLYPLLSRALAIGEPAFLPYSMYLLNLLAIAFGMYFFILILEHFSLNPAWSLLYGLSPPSIMTIQYDLPSPLSMALIITAVYFYLVKENAWASTLFFALALLTREDSVMVLFPLLLWDFQKKRSFARIAVFLTSLLPFLIWQYYVAVKAGFVATAASSTVIGLVPFSGIIGYSKLVTLSGLKETLKEAGSFLVFFYFMACAAAVLAALRRQRHFFYYVSLAYSLLAVFTVPSQWNNFSGLLRMFYGIFPFLVLSYGVEKGVYVKYCALFICALTFLTVVRITLISPVFPYKIW